MYKVVGTERIELSLTVPQTVVLPLYYAPHIGHSGSPQFRPCTLDHIVTPDFTYNQEKHSVTQNF